MCSRIEFWVVVQVSVRVAGNVTECLQVLIRSLTMTEREKIK